MRNKESVNAQPHDRPCFYDFKEKRTGLYWMIPFSSQVSKFKVYYNKKVLKIENELLKNSGSPSNFV